MKVKGHFNGVESQESGGTNIIARNQSLRAVNRIWYRNTASDNELGFFDNEVGFEYTDATVGTRQLLNIDTTQATTRQEAVDIVAQAIAQSNLNGLVIVEFEAQRDNYGDNNESIYNIYKIRTVKGGTDVKLNIINELGQSHEYDGSATN